MFQNRLMFLTIVFINFYNNNDRKMKKGRLKIWFQMAFCFKGMYLGETQTFIGSGKHKNKQRG